MTGIQPEEILQTKLQETLKAAPLTSLIQATPSILPDSEQLAFSLYLHFSWGFSICKDLPEKGASAIINDTRLFDAAEKYGAFSWNASPGYALFRSYNSFVDMMFLKTGTGEYVIYDIVRVEGRL